MCILFTNRKLPKALHSESVPRSRLKTSTNSNAEICSGEWLVNTDPSGCEFDTRLRQILFPAYFFLFPLKHVRKVVGGFGKKPVVLALV